VDDHRAQVPFVLDKRGKTCRIRRRDPAGNIEVTARNTRFEVANGTGAGGDGMHADAARLADHPNRIADGPIAVDCLAYGQSMDTLSGTGGHLLPATGMGTAKIALAHLMPGDRDLDIDRPALRLAARNADDDAFERDPSCALPLLDRGADGIFGGTDVDDRAP